MPVPPPDEFGVPAEPWLLAALLHLTFVLHLIFMNFVLAGTPFLVLLGAWRKPCEFRVRLKQKMMAILPVAISLTITTGIAPLLFVQALYGQFFYTANILLGWRWLISLALLIVAFYLAYGLAGDRWREKPLVWTAAGIIDALLFAAIAWIFVNNSVLSINPGYWKDFSGGGASFYIPDPSALPRFLHMAVGSTAVLGLWIVGIGRHELLRTGDQKFAEQATRLGMTLALIFTTVQVVVGLWLVWAVGTSRSGLFSASPGSIGWIMALAATGPMMFCMFRSRQRPRETLWSTSVFGLMALILLGMSMGRESIRAESVQESFRTSDLLVNWQVGPFLVFVGALVAAIAVVYMLMRWTWTASPAETGGAEGDKEFEASGSE
jgi:hypothetical protein